jgi:hypothetical protein
MLSSLSLTALATANVWSNLAVVPVVLLMLHYNRLMLIELFAELALCIFTFLYHLSQFANVAVETAFYMVFRRADLCTSQFAFVLAACDLSVVDAHTRQVVLLAWLVLHIWLHVANFYAIVSVYIAVAAIAAQLFAASRGLVRLRVHHWRFFWAALVLAAAGIVFYYLDDGEYSYYWFHSGWHGCIFAAQFCFYMSMRTTLDLELRMHILALLEYNKLLCGPSGLEL